MGEITVDRPQIPDDMDRDDRGFWQPPDGAKDPNPVFAWPPRPVEVLKWVWGYIFPWNLIYMAIATATTPVSGTFSTCECLYRLP